MANLTKKDKQIRLQHLAIISEFAMEMLRLNTVEEVVWYLARDVVAKLNFIDVVVYLVNEETGLLEQRAAFGDKNPTDYQILSPISLAIGQGLVGYAAQTKQVQLVNDTRQCPHYIVDDASRLSELAVPIIVENQLLGVIDSEHTDANFYQQEHIDTLNTVALIAGTKILKQRSIAKLQKTIEQLEYSSKIQDTLFEIAEIIFNSDSIEEFYRLLHQAIAKLTYAKNFLVAALTPDGAGIEFPYMVDQIDQVITDEVIAYNPDYPSITGYVIKNNTPLLATTAELQQLIDDKKVFVIGELPKAWLGVPLGNDENFSGAVVVQNYFDDYEFNDNDLQLLTFAARHIRNAIERLKAKEDLKFLALHDALTKLPNRLLFTDRINHAISTIGRKPDKTIAIMFLDLDRFKQINDTFGHKAGDELLIAVAQRMKSCLRVNDTLCRLGGDEFAILMEDVASRTEALDIAERIIELVQQPFRIGEQSISTSTSIGITLSSDAAQQASTLIKQADQAMYYSKSHGRNQVNFYRDIPTEATQISFEQEFIYALTQNQLTLRYQPIIEYRSGRLLGVEVLVRWRHPTRGLLRPREFLPLAENLALMPMIDKFVLAQVFKLIKQLKDKLPPNFLFCVNISEQGLKSSELIKGITQVYLSAPYRLRHICFEVSEQIYAENIGQVKKHINQLRAMGALMSLDDFGTGFSSLSHLEKFTFDQLKIDQAFTQELSLKKPISIILQTIINMAKSLDMRVVIEGVENEEQYRKLAEINVELAQGYFIAKPFAEQKLRQIITQPYNFKPALQTHVKR